MSLKQKAKKIKSFYPVLHYILIFNVCVTLGLYIYLYDNIYNNEPIKYQFGAFDVPDLNSKIGENRGVSVENPNNLGSVDQIVASKNGTKYYYPNCSGINRIKNENRVFFDTFEAAEEAGYELAKNCKKP
jgi:hypothetical protein